MISYQFCPARLVVTDSFNADTSLLHKSFFHILLKSQTRRLFEPGIYSGPAVYLLNAFFSIGGLLNQQPNFNKNI